MKAYDIEISYYKFNVISTFQKFRLIYYAPTCICLFPRVCVLFHTHLFIASLSKTGKRGKDRE